MPCHICHCPDSCIYCEGCKEHCACPARVEGVGPEAPTIENEAGGRQSDSPYRCDLLPAIACLLIAKVLKHGAVKYGENNWRKISRQENINHALTHLLALQAGDTSDDHLTHAACRLLFAMETK